MSYKFFLLSSCVFFFTEPLLSENKWLPKKKVDLKIKTKYMDIPREFTEDIVGHSLSYLLGLTKNVKKHPALFVSCLAGLWGACLYSKELQQINVDITKPIYEYKNVSFLVGLSCLGVAFLKRDYLLGMLPEENDGDFSVKDSDLNFANFSKSLARIYFPGEILTTFKDVAGLETAKDELNDILMFLKDQDPFFQIGAKIPKGVLLSGSPGNGKTLLARALAGEVQCPFLYVNGSEFVEAIVGIGAARIRNLFAIAKKLAPCILFIDEIDSVGKKRVNSGFGGGDTEITQTLNQLLAEMDGFEQHKDPIVVIGATNRVDILDSALLRPGRFDRKIEITLPFVKDRYEILKLHFSHIKTAADLDIYKIAKGTPGYTGAELAHLVNEAAIIALRDQKEEVTMLHVDQARDNINLGRETKGMDISHEEYWQTAVHEAGHALALVYQPDAEPLHKVTIVPRAGSLGITFSMGRERYSRFEQNFKSRIIFCLGGSVAEEIMFAGRGIGACSDLKEARNLATQMVMHYGMTKEFKDITFERYINDEVHLPDALAAKLQIEINNIIHECRKIAFDIISKHKDKLEQLVAMLLEQGTVYGSDVYKLCGLKEQDIEYSLASKQQK
ncbi:ATP-dependent zinc metalloprotease FtsH [Candidatus Dependentiae bacterium]|nr:ATP-dependent zinc metalloprotease FtsH [Candidatus Dependentiae bacterium]